MVIKFGTIKHKLGMAAMVLRFPICDEAGI